MGAGDAEPCAQSPYTKNLPAKIAWLKLSGKLPMGLGIPPLEIKTMLEANPLKSRILVRRLAVSAPWRSIQRDTFGAPWERLRLGMLWLTAGMVHLEEGTGVEDS